MDGTSASEQRTSAPTVLDLVSFDEIHRLARSASRVIAPLGPMTSFAARSPWMGLENQSFHDVAHWLNDTCGVDIYPNASLLQSAVNRRRIQPKFLDTRLRQWLDAQSLKLPRHLAQQFCSAALKLEDISISLLEDTEVQKCAHKLSRLMSPMPERRSLQTVSFRYDREKELNFHVIKWCKLFLNRSAAAWTLPNRKEGFYLAWRNLVSRDPVLNRTQRELLKNLPQQPEDALRDGLRALEIPTVQIQNYLEAHLLSLPGWAGMMLWHSEQLLFEYLAIRISLELTLMHPHLPLPEPQPDDQALFSRWIAQWCQWGGLSIEAWSQLSITQQQARLTLASQFDDLVRRQLWLEAWEDTYEDQIKTMISSKRVATGVKESALAQLVFCIDTRSEPFRRVLEEAGPFETLGVAGFFGLPIETCHLGSSHSHPSLPIVLKPQHKIKELATEKSTKSYQEHRQAALSISHLFQEMKQNVLTSLLLPEFSGSLLGMQMLLRSMFPVRANRTFRQLRRRWLQKPPTTLSLDPIDTEPGLPIGFSDAEKVYYVHQSLKTMGLTENFAPLIVICGHGSRSTNNPYAAALDCGACGGASGAFNARVLAMLCNQEQVRKALENDGIHIPEDTVFAAVEHITTVNELRWLYVPKLSGLAQEAFRRIQEACPKVREILNKEQLSRLPHLKLKCVNPNFEIQRQAEDWSEVRPEWGLARNAAFFIGSRRLVKECDFDGRVFLHNYDWRADDDGTLLASIIAGPATVAQWINLQYYASTVAPHYYGSGNKATQTVTAGLGVMQGNASDLLSGLPWQSVMESDEEFYHDPLRLLLVIEAPHEYLERLFDKDPTFLQKVSNGWMRLAIMDPQFGWESFSNKRSAHLDKSRKRISM
ncbi:DUF2309 domain-containing protein [Alicyclobacillus sp. SP_1]|uniref:DUF2309 domain-containing protein n=1 Tax=Alicyclobacillus sp. SP_1 TaxID=2942475 RepID=UPI002157F734|nr:putative inorganic carbon transporter subunit DabA [Alicyclobacillus sp. SP_1]